jgi:hypothetical protein
MRSVADAPVLSSAPGVVWARFMHILRSMWIEAIVSAEELRQTLSRFAPVTIRLGDEGGELALDSPSQVTLLPDKGARVVCRARLVWPLLGVHVPIAMKSLVVLLCPLIEAQPEGGELVFKLEIEHADFALIPTFIDDRLTTRINTELAKKRIELSWRYAETLDHVFRMPDALDGVDALGLVVTGAVVKVTKEAVGLAVSLRSDVRRSDERDAGSTSQHHHARLAG